MKLTFKTLKNEQFELEVPDSAAVPAVKAAVATHQGNAPAADGYRLIYSGKVLRDEDTLTSAGVTSSGFLVVMPPSKAKPKPAAPPAEKKEAPAAAAAAPAAAAAAAAAAAPAATPAAAAATPAPAATAAAPAGAGGSLLTGPAYEESVKRIVDMGFPEAQVKSAMRAAFNNPDRAVEYLFSGIPEMAEPPTEAAAAAAAPGDAPNTEAAAAALAAMGVGTGAAAAGGGGANAGAGGIAPGTPFNMFAPPPAGGAGSGAGAGGGGAGNLDFLRRVPQFNVLRRLIQSNPQLLAQLLSQLDQANPALLSLINANQAEFVRLINEPVPPGEEGGEEEMAQLAAAMVGAGAGEGGRGMGGGGQGQIYVTEEENQQLTRLTELGQTMGLERGHVVEAWLACDRNENLAANYLFDHMEEIKAAQEEDAATDAQGDGEGDAGNPPSGSNPPA